MSTSVPAAKATFGVKKSQIPSFILQTFEAAKTKNSFITLKLIWQHQKLHPNLAAGKKEKKKKKKKKERKKEK